MRRWTGILVTMSVFAASSAFAAETNTACAPERALLRSSLFRADLAVAPVEAITPAPVPTGHGVFQGVRFDTRTPCRRAALTLRLADDGAAGAAEQTAPVKAFLYSDGYRTRDKIHHIASYAMLPLFIGEAILGQDLFNHPSKITETKTSLHATVGIGIGTLFGVNSVTGLWNMWEGRKDPNGGMRRTMHGALMLVADAGFFATSLTTPNESPNYDAKKNQHLTIAYASLAVATVGYVMMLFR